MTLHLSYADLASLVGAVVFVVLFFRWGQHVGRQTPKPKRASRPVTEYERGYRAGWRRAIWFWWTV